jgi:hypothetical protein
MRVTWSQTSLESHCDSFLGVQFTVDAPMGQTSWCKSGPPYTFPGKRQPPPPFIPTLLISGKRQLPPPLIHTAGCLAGGAPVPDRRHCRGQRSLCGHAARLCRDDPRLQHPPSKSERPAMMAHLRLGRSGRGGPMPQKVSPKIRGLMNGVKQALVEQSSNCRRRGGVVK